MDFFNLPSRSKVGRVVPKNAFDEYTNTKQKKQLTDSIQRITWTHKISTKTVNLESADIKEIQVFKVELKEQTDISKILDIINKAIPYHIVFWVELKEEAYISATAKHPHPTNEDTSVIDWTFTSEWFKKDKNTYCLNLKGSLTAVFKNLCVQITGKPGLGKKSMDSILKYQQEVERLKNEIASLSSGISKGKQFNQKVELNIRLNNLQKQLDRLEQV